MSDASRAEDLAREPLSDEPLSDEPLADVWEDWAEAWRDEDAAPVATPPARELARHVIRRGRWLAWLTFLEIAFLVAFCIWAGRLVWLDPDQLDRGVIIWGFCLVGIVFTFWNRRGLWPSEAQNTTAFIELSRQRLRRGWQAWRFGWWLFVAELIVLIPWVAWKLRDREIERWLVAGVWILGAMIFAAGSLRWWRWRLEREARQIDAFAEEVSSDEQPGEAESSADPGRNHG